LSLDQPNRFLFAHVDAVRTPEKFRKVGDGKNPVPPNLSNRFKPAPFSSWHFSEVTSGRWNVLSKEGRTRAGRSSTCLFQQLHVLRHIVATLLKALWTPFAALSGEEVPRLKIFLERRTPGAVTYV
jgi:hypothetical protein